MLGVREEDQAVRHAQVSEEACQMRRLRIIAFEIGWYLPWPPRAKRWLMHRVKGQAVPLEVAEHYLEWMDHGKP